MEVPSHADDAILRLSVGVCKDDMDKAITKATKNLGYECPTVSKAAAGGMLSFSRRLLIVL